MSSNPRRPLLFAACLSLLLFGLAGLATAEEAPAIDAPLAEVTAAAEATAPADVAAEPPGSCQAEGGVDLGIESPLAPVETTPTTCSAMAWCSSGTVSCTGGCPSDRRNASCPSQRGWVKCGSKITYCPPCPPLPCNPSCDVICGLGAGVCSNGQCYCY
ncbi:MAG: hypothetical protein AAGE94_02995 [Acidobacteriota bacterium]